MKSDSGDFISNEVSALVGSVDEIYETVKAKVLHRWPDFGSLTRSSNIEDQIAYVNTFLGFINGFEGCNGVTYLASVVIGCTEDFIDRYDFVGSVSLRDVFVECFLATETKNNIGEVVLVSKLSPLMNLYVMVDELRFEFEKNEYFMSMESLVRSMYEGEV